MAQSVVIPPGFGLATLKWTFIPAGKVMSVTFGYKDEAAADTPDVAAAAYRSAILITGGPFVPANVSNQWRFEGCTVLQRLAGGVLQAGSALTAVTGSGSGGADANPVFTTLVVSKNTLYAGRAYRGRIYPPFVSGAESEVDFNGTIQSSVVTIYQNQWNAFRGAASISPYTPYLLHTAPPVGPALPPTAITTLRVRPVVGIQRRRRAKGA